MGFIDSGGDRFKICGFLPAAADSRRKGKAAWEVKNVPRTFTSNIKSNRFAGVSSVLVKLIALALFTRISIPPKVSAANLTAASIWFSSLKSHWIANAFPPAASISAAAV